MYKLLIKSKGGQAYENTVSGVNADRILCDNRNNMSCGTEQLGYLTDDRMHCVSFCINRSVRFDSVHIAGKEKTPQRLQSLTAHKQYFSSKEYHKLKGMSNDVYMQQMRTSI